MRAPIKLRSALWGRLIRPAKIKRVSITVFLHILQRVNARREDEEHGRSGARLFKGDGEVQWSANHVLAPQLLLHKVSAGRIWVSSPSTLFFFSYYYLWPTSWNSWRVGSFFSSGAIQRQRRREKHISLSHDSDVSLSQIWHLKHCAF